MVSWIIGEKSLQKGLQLVKGKDTIVLTFMFLFPWGITLWVSIFVITCVLCVIIYKNGESIEKKIKGFFKRKNANGKSDSAH